MGPAVDLIEAIALLTGNRTHGVRISDMRLSNCRRLDNLIERHYKSEGQGLLKISVDEPGNLGLSTTG
jgi:hypothetical protein